MPAPTPISSPTCCNTAANTIPQGGPGLPGGFFPCRIILAAAKRTMRKTTPQGRAWRRLFRLLSFLSRRKDGVVLQSRLVCGILCMSFLRNGLPLLLCAVARPHSFRKGSFSLYTLRQKPFSAPLAWRGGFRKHKKGGPEGPPRIGAEDEARTRYLHLGKVALYQMSYSRAFTMLMYYTKPGPACQGGIYKKTGPPQGPGLSS